MAHCLSEKVRDLGLLTDSYSPFSKQAEKFGVEWKGGHPDDVTIIVSQIQSEAHWQIRQGLKSSFTMREQKEDL